MKISSTTLTIVMLAVTQLLAAGNAGALVLDASQRGAYRGDLNSFGTGFSGTSFGNYQTGINTGLGGGPSIADAELRSFFNFDLSGISEPIAGATFTISTIGTFGSSGALAPVTVETITIFDVTTDISALISGTGGAEIGRAHV